MITKTIEERLDDLESIYTDLPQLLNARFDGVNGRFDEISSRTNLLDRQTATLIRDVRDMRGGVTRQLVAQDGEIAAMTRQLVAQDVEIAAIKGLILDVLSRLPGS